jgi:NDP-sugar pyrophosphorylase family protein
MVNAHHFPEQIRSHLDDGRPFGIPVHVSVEPDILGTGGGIKKTEDFWGREPFVVINSDIVTDIDLSRAYQAHRRDGVLATLILHRREPFNQVLINESLDIVRLAKSPMPSGLAFTGIHIMNPALLHHLPAGVYSDIIDCYRSLMDAGTPPKGYRVEKCYWRDIGTPESYMAANRESLGDQNLLLGPACRLAGSARIADWAVIGEYSVMEEESRIQRSVLWDRVRIRQGVTVTDSIVTSSKVVESDIHGEIL